MSTKLTAVEQIIKEVTGKLERRLFVIAGPSGVGKNTIIKELLATHPEFARVKTYTTRSQRDGEIEGEQYYFVTREQFMALATEDKLMEADADNPLGHDVYDTDDSYSMPSDIFEDIPNGISIVLAEVDIVGAKLLKDNYPGCVTIFVTAPPLDLLQRIRERPDEEMTDKNLRQRLEKARTHMQAAAKFDYVVFNRKSQLCRTVQACETIIAAERKRVMPGFDLEASVPEEAFKAAFEAAKKDRNLARDQA